MIMARNLFNATVKAGKIDQRHVQIALALVTLGLFVLGAGAPASFGGVGG
jgi:hypothetical protein